ncbi:T9SS sorting signal type C domain-containing protein [Flavobacterium sp. LS1R49]|uniref:T9SS sorting signal type C domain-containing protein n=1 Tax=Flavobacterium shii TaxID=2987687 RepID=A0A9X2ZHB0_9FLAO|nr:T9SS sorting signal type C domain-containing protein [Flavobacterium shii]MCV9927698.1 T9SS sorting signal type C domain-containing protein [Flavobacterium shii]
MKTKQYYLLFIASFIFVTTSNAQQGAVDTTFNTYDDGHLGDGFDNIVRTIALQLDGDLIVGGDYLNFNGASANYLCRLKPDGSIDKDFNIDAGFNGKIYTSFIQNDGKIIIGGAFTTYLGVISNRLVRLNQDGSRDTSFNTNGAGNGIVYDVTQQTDGKIIVVGSFSQYNGVVVNRVVRLNPNGSLDTSFLTGSGSLKNITNAQIQTDGKIIVTGSFNIFNGVESNHIIRLNTDGSIDRTFNIGTGFNNDVSALALQSEGKILLGGKFTTYNGESANRIIRLNGGGEIDSSFLSGTGFSNDGVAAIKVNSANDIMIGGSFTGKYNGESVNRLIFLDANGTIKPNFDSGSGPASASVLTLATSSDGSWFVGGSFSVFDSQNQGRLAKIDSDGALDSGYLTAGVGFDNSVSKIISLQDNKAMVFGSFTKFNGEPSLRIACLLEDGSSDIGFNLNGSGANNAIKTAVLQPNNKIVIAGSFTNYNGKICNRITRILANGSIDEGFTIGTGFNNQVYALALQADSKIIVAGNFTSYNGISAIRIARLKTDGTIDSDFVSGLGANALIEALFIQPDGKILVGGRFDTFNGHVSPGLVRLNSNGSIDTSFVTGIGFDKYVYAIALQSDNKIILGGSFLVYNGVSKKRIVRLNPNGSLDNSFIIGTGFNKGDVRSILVQPDDCILVGGTFSGTYNEVTSMQMLRLQKNGLYDTSFQANLNNTLFSMCFTPDYKVLIGGNFNSVSGQTKHRIARLKLCVNSSGWDGLNWTNGLPSGGKELVFHDNYTFLNSVNACSCSIDEGKIVTVPRGETLGLSFNYSGLGTLVLEDTAALYQSDDEMINTGFAEVKRRTTPILKFDYTYWSSPVENQKLIDVSPNTLSDKYFSYDTSVNNWKEENPLNNMILGKGYIIRGPQEFSEINGASFEAAFKGIPVNGKVSVLLESMEGYNLIGNPYPSAIDASIFISQNTSNINGTLYFWTHNTPITDREYNSDDYAAYNLLGGVATRPALSSGINTTRPDGNISSGQAFFVASNGTGKANFDNSMRIINRNSSFFKPSKVNNLEKESSVERHRIWLNLTNNKGTFKQILIGYINGATGSCNPVFDGESFNGNKFVNFYSIKVNKNLVIQAKALPFEDTDLVPLGYSSTIAGDFTIAIDKVDGLLLNREIYLEDKRAHIIHNLSKTNYAFTTEIGTLDDRFVLRYTNETLDTGEFDVAENIVLVSVANKEIKINAFSATIDKVFIYDVSGKKIYQRNNVNTSQFETYKINALSQMVIVKVELKNKATIVRKVML